MYYGTQFVDNTPIAAWQLELEAREEAARAAAPPDAVPPPERTVWRRHAFDWACERLGVEHRLTKPAHPWTNGQVERMNRTLKDATVRRYYYDTHDQLRGHLQLFLDAYNYARRLKTLRGLTPYEFICKAWAEEPHRFTRDPTHDTVGPNTVYVPLCGGTRTGLAVLERRDTAGAWTVAHRQICLLDLAAPALVRLAPGATRCDTAAVRTIRADQARPGRAYLTTAGAPGTYRAVYLVYRADEQGRPSTRPEFLLPAADRRSHSFVITRPP